MATGSSPLSSPLLLTLATSTTVLMLLLLPLPAARAMEPLIDMTPEGVGVVKTDLPYIRCGVCQLLAKQLHKQVQAKRKAAAPKPLDELKIIEITEKVCDRKKPEGSWIQYHDMVEDGDKIKLEEYDYEGECLSECRTIQRACEQVMGEHDTELSAVLLKADLTRAQLEKHLCHEVSDACAVPTPPVPQDRKPGEKFEKKKDPDYSQMAKEMGVKESVMHDESKFDFPSSMPRMPPPKDFAKEKAARTKKVKKGKKRSKKPATLDAEPSHKKTEL